MCVCVQEECASICAHVHPLDAIQSVLYLETGRSETQDMQALGSDEQYTDAITDGIIELDLPDGTSQMSDMSLMHIMTVFVSTIIICRCHPPGQRTDGDCLYQMTT